MQGRKIELPVERVTLLEDRAQVTRRGTVALEAGLNQLIVAEVAPVLVDKTLAVDPDGDVEVVEACVLRHRVLREEDRPEEVAELDRQARSLEARRTRVEREQALVAGHLRGLAKAAYQAVGELAVDASWGRVDPSGWEARFEQLHAAESLQRGRAVELEHEAEDLSIRVQDLEARRETADDVRSSARADLYLVLSADEATEVTLCVEYLVPGACWRPWHQATVRDGRLRFRCDGCVWQNTGEDWEDARLFFSTERASLGVEPPELCADELYVRPVGREVRVETREQEIHTAGLGGGGSTTTSEMPGIDDGGEPRRLAAMAPARVPSDGRPHRFPAFEFEVPVKEQRILKAELAAAVIVRSEQDNGAALPILPGPVDLVRDSGLVGRTWADFVAPGETFELGWGPDLALRVHREHDREHLDSKLFSSWTATRHEIKVRLSNIGPEDKVVEVTERVPVSELDKVKIELKSADPSGRPDEDGFLKWSLTVPGYQRDEVRVEYEVKQHPDVRGLSI